MFVIFADNEVLISRQSRALSDDSIKESNVSNGLNSSDDNVPSRVVAMRLQTVSKDVGYADEGHIEALLGHEVPLILFGFGFSNETQVVFTSAESKYGSDCRSDGDLSVKTSSYRVMASEDGTQAHVTIPGKALPSVEGEEVFYVCLKNSPEEGKFIHQGSDSFGTQVHVKELILPIWLMIVFIVILLCLSGLFSGDYTSRFYSTCARSLNLLHSCLTK